MRNIILIGGGGHCRACIDVIEQAAKFRIVGIIDNNICYGEKICGYPVLGNDSVLPILFSETNYALITIGQLRNVETRVTLYEHLCSLGYLLPSIISPRAYVARDVQIGGGSIVMHGAIINTCAQVGVNSIINTNALIEHDAVIGSHCHLSTGVIVNGGAKIGSESFLGSGSIVIQEVSIPEHTFIKANQIVKG